MLLVSPWPEHDRPLLRESTRFPPRFYILTICQQGKDSECFRTERLRALVRSSRESSDQFARSKLTHYPSVVFASLIAATSISTITPTITAFTNASAAASELFRIIDKRSELDPLDPAGKRPQACEGNITINDLSFAYPARPGAAVLHDFNLSIPAGKTTAVVGPSGSGKSTLVALLEKWYTPIAGTVLLDGIDISRYNTKWLRSRIRLVQQVYETKPRFRPDRQLTP